MTTSPVIDVRNLWFSYNGQPVLRDVSLQIRQGEFLAMIGPNGGGKTTLLKLMLGLLSPKRGRIRIFGEPPRRAVHRIGYVPQDVHINKNFPVSVLDVVLMGRLGTGKGWNNHSRKDRAVAREVLDRMGMGGFGHQRIGDLSGGQRQRVFIARALATDPEILFLDEPTASIDSRGQNDFYDLLKRLNQTMTILMVSHDMMMLHSHVQSVACVNRAVHYHDEAEITSEMIDMYECPVELVAHGIPHRVLKNH